jgi:protein-L-isoaspartate(D-aspartate) O-methyltransferase
VIDSRNFGRLWPAAAGVILGGMVLGVWSPLCRPAPAEGETYMSEREAMVRLHLEARGIADRAVLQAMRKVPREEFVPPQHRRHAYADSALPIEARQTISQPYIVAAMTEALQVKPDAVVLEVGTGSGYQAAVLAEIVHHVYTIEIVESLATTARERLEHLGYTNITVRAGDGYQGWPEHAPFDGIIVTAAPDHIPQPLIEQLKPGGRMVIPVGEQFFGQDLLLIKKDADGTVSQRNLMGVRFVPLTGPGTETQ